MRTFSLVLLLSLVLPLAQGAAAQGGQPPAQGVQAQQSAFLRPGDAIRVQIWREGDLSGEFPVNVNGMVTLPLLGELKLTDVPTDSLRDFLLEKYRVHLRNPSINITPLRRVNVLGEVQRPGMYAVDPTISLAGVVALAGGTTPDGDLNRIQIVREGAVIQERVGAAQTLTAADIRSGDQVMVERRGWFSRNTALVVSALISVTSIVTSIILTTRTRSSSN
ncbi:MAG TPA: polysaccharide biosynthesis/export family protein [Longimicrobium sp.]|nr:polysaccharide biosynthesis/export family protein [Longimicrobium sp.]